MINDLAMGADAAARDSAYLLDKYGTAQYRAAGKVAVKYQPEIWGDNNNKS